MYNVKFFITDENKESIEVVKVQEKKNEEEQKGLYTAIHQQQLQQQQQQQQMLNANVQQVPMRLPPQQLQAIQQPQPGKII